jgi:HlyD family secretion protein
MNDVAPVQGVDPEVAEALKLETKRGRKRRRWIWITGGALVVVVLLFAVFGHKPPQAYQLGTIERATLNVHVTATGSLEPLNSVDVGAEVSGRIDTVNVDFNDRVTKGEVLAQINTDQLSAKLAQAKASLAQAKAHLSDSRAALHDAQLTYNRVQPLAKTGAASKATLDTDRIAVERAQANVESAEAQVQQTQAAQDSDQSALEKATIRAPIDGIVLDRLVEPGQTVAATFQTPVLFKLAEDLSKMQLEVDVDEADIGEVKLGQKATFTVDAYPGRQFDAEITQIRNAPTTEQGVVTYPVVLLVSNKDLSLKPGMTATAEILVQHVTNALTVPSGALRFVPEGQDETPPTPLPDGSGNYSAKLWLPAGRAPKPVAVIAGASDGERTAIVKGDVKAGEKVIVDIQRKKRPQRPQG